MVGSWLLLVFAWLDVGWLSGGVVVGCWWLLVVGLLVVVGCLDWLLPDSFVGSAVVVVCVLCVVCCFLVVIVVGFVVVWFCCLLVIVVCLVLLFLVVVLVGVVDNCVCVSCWVVVGCGVGVCCDLVLFVVVCFCG